MEEKKRQIARHVDGRIKIAEIIPLKNFLILLPIDGTLLYILIKIIIKFKNPFLFFIGFSLIGVFSMMFFEFKFRETGLDILKDTIKSFKRGNIHTERGMMK